MTKNINGWRKNNLFVYPIKKKKDYKIYIVEIIVIIIGVSLMIHAQHQIKKDYSFTKEESVKILEHKFNPKESVIEIEDTNNGVRIKNPEEIIAEVSKEENFKDVNYLISLAACESSLGQRMINTKNNHPVTSKDLGWYQINNYWHSEVSEECAYDLRCSTKWVIGMIKAGKKSQWVCNKFINN